MRRLNNRHRLILVWTLRIGIVLVAITLWAIASGTGESNPVIPGQHVEGLTSVLSRGSDDRVSPIRFEDVTAASGLSFRHFPAERASLLPEDMGSGVACGDYDSDGLTDIFLVNFSSSLLKPRPAAGSPGGCRLYRNLGEMRFEDVTGASGLDLSGYGMGAAWGDYDNDGDLDLYVTTYGDNMLYENAGDGTFTNVTQESGANDPRFSTGCNWSDYDRDGDLDLYVCNYVDFILRESDRDLSSRQYGKEQPSTLNPSAYAPQSNSLFRNNGDGTFEEVAVVAGVADASGRSLSASWVDMNNDGWPDLYVANDVSNNGVFLNRGDATFEDVGPSSLAADYRGAMGIAASDFDNDLDMDLLVTHWIAQENALFRNMFIDPMFDADAAERLWFLDAADEVGLGQVSLDTVGWATGFVDFDNDGRRDLWIANGSTFEMLQDRRRLRPQPPFIFWNRGDEDFIDVAESASDSLSKPVVARGGASADFDQDGCVDLIMLAHGGGARLFKNVSEPIGHWMRVLLKQPGGNRFALGARVYITTGSATQMAEVGAGSSYLSQDELAIHFGLGDHRSVDEVRIVWPDGGTEVKKDLPSNRAFTFVRASDDL